MKLVHLLTFIISFRFVLSLENDNSSGEVPASAVEIKNRLLNMLQFDKIDDVKSDSFTYKVIYSNIHVPYDTIKKIVKVVNRNEPIHDTSTRNYSDNDAALSYFWLMCETMFIVDSNLDSLYIKYNEDVLRYLINYIILVDKAFSSTSYLNHVKDSENIINDFIYSFYEAGVPVSIDELIDRVATEIVRLLTLLVENINLEGKFEEENRIPNSFLSRSFQWQFGIHDNSFDSNNDKLFAKLSSFDFFSDKLSSLTFRPQHVLKMILNTRYTSNFNGTINNLPDESLNFSDIYKIFELISNLPYKKSLASNVDSLFRPKTCPSYSGRFGNLESEYLMLSQTSIAHLNTEMLCMRGFLFVFGFPDSKGRLAFPYGWPRNIDYGLSDIISGQASGGGLCYTLIGFLLAIGYPPVVNGYSGITVTNSGGSIHVLPPLSHLKIPYDTPHNLFKYPEEKSGFDQPFISFVTGSNLGDTLSMLAHSYYLKSGFGHVSNVYMGLPKSSHYSIHRPTDESPVKCLRAIPYILEVARQSIHLSNGDNWLHPDTNDSYAFTMTQNPHEAHNASRYYAEFIKSIASEGNTDGIRALGELYYMGHDDGIDFYDVGEISRDIVRALRIWGDAAESGDPVSALAVASVHLQSGSNSLSSAEPFLNLVLNDPKSTKEQIYLAKFYMARYGLGRDKNPYEAGEYLLKAGTFGDTMTQMLIGHAYAGILVGVKMHEGTNLYRALKHYKYAANAGSVVGKYNSAILTIQGYDPSHSTAYDRCNAAYPLLHSVAMKNVNVSSLVHMAKRAEILNDQTGALLSYMMLSEIGHPTGHVRSSKLWKYRKYDNYLSPTFSNNLVMSLASKLTGLISSSVPLSQKEYYKFSTKYSILGESKRSDKNDILALHYQHLLKSEYLFCFARPVSYYQGLLNGETQTSLEFLTGNDANELCLFYYSMRAAARKDPDAMSFIANSYLANKKWINQDYSTAFKWAIEASKIGNGMGLYISARLLERGFGVDRNCDMALSYYKNLSESNLLESQIVGNIMIWTTAINRLIYNLQKRIGFELVKFKYEPCDPKLIHIELPSKFYVAFTVVSTIFSLIVGTIIYYI